MSSRINIDNYLKRIDFEINNIDKIPGGMPDWILNDLANYREKLIKNINNYSAVKDIIFYLENDIFYALDVLKENDMDEIRNMREIERDNDNRVANMIAIDAVINHLNNHRR